MKKKIQKSLKLNRETLTSLNHGNLREAVGAVTAACGTTTTNQTASTCAYRNTNCVGW
jgi:hypothetical protein